MLRIIRLAAFVFVFSHVPLRAADPSFTKEQVLFYEKDVKPLLAEHCFKCHAADAKKIRGGLILSNRAAVLKGGESGPAVNLEKPADSLLLLAINNKRADGGEVMPPSGQLPAKSIETLTKWVSEKLPVSAAELSGTAPSAAHATGGVVTDESKKYWAYQPVVRPPVPTVKDAAAIRTPIDSFLQEKREAKGLTPNGVAAKAVLARRAYYDLLGLPPTPEQLDAFVKDDSPKAFEKLIDTLLASPQYGEKWGRHWLDVVRYAETNGYERDGPKPHAWKYRDYVIRSFNDDKPYDQFVKEQIAGDEMKPWKAENLIATGFYRLGLWDDEPADKPLALYDHYDDLVTVVGQGMLAMSLNCNRCHDHKRDPFPHADYYRFLAFFRDIRPFEETGGKRASSNTVDVTTGDERAKYEKPLKDRQAKIATIRALMKPIEDAVIKTLPPEDQLAVDDGHREEIVERKVLISLKGEDRKTYDKYRHDVDKLLAEPLPNQTFAMGVGNCQRIPPTVYVLARGNPGAPKENEPCKPGYPSVLGIPDPEIKLPDGVPTSGRRTVLADWLASPTNPLTARVMVNRLWQHHFGKGIVPTPNDFGKLGELPTHPALLDYLAADFVEGGWKIKRMHKLIMLSSAYQMASTASASNITADPANNLYWRFAMRRLTAEEVRDSMQMVGGQLNLEAGGPSVYPKISAEVLAGQSVPGQGWLLSKGGGYDPKHPEKGNRRSVYTHVKRSLQVPILIAHDQADTDSTCPVRYTTTVPTQALGMLNGEFTNEVAEALAKRVTKEHPGDVAAQVTRAIRLTTGRMPAADEVAKDVAFIETMQSKHGLDAATALQRYMLLAVNANEFVYVD